MLHSVSGLAFAMDVTVYSEVQTSGIGRAYLHVLLLSHIGIVPPIHHTHLHLYNSYRTYKEAKLGEVQETMLFQKSVLDRKLFPLIFALQRQFHKSGFKDPATWPRGKGLQPVQNMQDFLRTNWQSDRFFSQYYCFPPANIDPPFLHTHLYLKTTLLKRTRGRSFPKSGNIIEEKILYCFSCFKDSYITVFWMPSEIFLSTSEIKMVTSHK